MPPRISLVHQFDQQQDETLQLAFSQDGKQLASSDGHALYFWRLNENENWSYEYVLPLQGAGILRFAPDIIFFIEGESVKLLTFDGRETAIFPRPFSRFWAVTPDLHWLVSNDKGRAIRLWNLASHQSFPIPLPFLRDEQNIKNTDLSDECVLRFLFTPDSQQVVLFASSPEGDLNICSFDPEQRHITLQKTLPGMIDGAISPNGKMLAIILPNEQIFAYKEDIYIYNLDSQQLLHLIPQITKTGYSFLAFSPDSRYLASCKSDGWIDIFSLDSFEQEIGRAHV